MRLSKRRLSECQQCGQSVSDSEYCPYWLCKEAKTTGSPEEAVQLWVVLLSHVILELVVGTVLSLTWGIKMSSVWWKS